MQMQSVCHKAVFNLFYAARENVKGDFIQLPTPHPQPKMLNPITRTLSNYSFQIESAKLPKLEVGKALDTRRLSALPSEHKQ